MGRGRREGGGGGRRGDVIDCEIDSGDFGVDRGWMQDVALRWRWRGIWRISGREF